MTLKKSTASSLYSCLIPGFSVDGTHNHNNESDESEFVAKFSMNPSRTMSKSGTTHCTAPTVLMNELSVEGGDDTYGNGRRDASNYSLSSSSNASPTDHWNNSFANFNITPHSSPSQSPSQSQSSPYNYQTAAEHHHSSSSLSSSSSFLRRTYLEEQQQQQQHRRGSHTSLLTKSSSCLSVTFDSHIEVVAFEHHETTSIQVDNYNDGSWMDYFVNH
mmetsp:Transcript_1156/g.1247  ORF Transcript_1156/g.1247 Transcript_1156/m.1247 type:complete len:217 (-) Transcript_1156:248-898(-)